MTDSEMRRLALAIVRGEAAPSDVARLGVSIDESDREWRAIVPGRVPTVLPSVADIASGALANQSHPSELRAWAQIVLGCDFFDLARLEAHDQGDALLGLIWDMAFGDTSAAQSDLVTRLAESRG